MLLTDFRQMMRTRIDRALFAAAAVAFASSAAMGAGLPQTRPRAEQPDPQTLGPQVGQRVPAFTLQDQQGTSRTLASLMGPKGLMLVFFRSADW
jgi:cytochrome oxidase Cu insertion factor (SCO1/SenC/PrrC family)